MSDKEKIKVARMLFNTQKNIWATHVQILHDRNTYTEEKWTLNVQDATWETARIVI